MSTVDTPVLAPTGDAQRIDSLDVMRGVALLGILLMNITGFGLPHAYSDPSIYGGATGWNLKVWWMDAMFFEGTMRGMFSMLFGAGLYIFASRIKDRGVQVADAYFRRLLWLFLFGIIHAYILLWDGEILYPYALIGMFAFVFRNWKPKYLVMAAVFLLLCSTALNVKDYYKNKIAYDKAMTAEAKKKKNLPLVKTDSTAISSWEGIVGDRKPSKEKIDEDIKERQKGYFSILWYKASINQVMQSFVMYRYFFWDILGMILLGMAFFKNGILKAERSWKLYLLMVLAGYAIGLSINYWETRHILRNNYSIMSFSLTEITYDAGRVFTTLGHIGLIMLFIKSGILGFLRKALGATGRMAFSNYIMQTIICVLLFMGFGFGLFGKLQRYELYYIVGSIWIFQLLISPIWLKYFRFGPLEWAWRSLTYWKKQPFKK